MCIEPETCFICQEVGSETVLLERLFYGICTCCASVPSAPVVHVSCFIRHCETFQPNAHPLCLTCNQPLELTAAALQERALNPYQAPFIHMTRGLAVHAQPAFANTLRAGPDFEFVAMGPMDPPETQQENIRPVRRSLMVELDLVDMSINIRIQ